MNIILWVKENRYEIIALLTGASVMMLEIAGARLIAPYFGSSVYVWTAMIGVILASLSVGFWYGGKAADKDNPKKDLSLIITVAAILVAVMTLLYQPVLEIIAEQKLDLRLSAIIAAIVLFSIPSALIGMVSPHLAKIRVDSLDTSGAKIGRLEAAGAIGSILGTFAAGYFLLAYFGSRDLTVFLAFVLMLTSFLADKKRIFVFRIVVMSVLIGMLFFENNSSAILLDKDTSYTRYQVERAYINGKEANLLRMDVGSIQSAYYVDEPGVPPLSYAVQIMNVIEKVEDKDSVLVIGGGAHTVPTILNKKYPEMTIQVVEIDPALDQIAIDYFGYTPNEKISISYQDGRTFLNSNTEKYDIIIIDAYSYLTPPFQISSLEAVEGIKNSLSDEGIVMTNIASRANQQMLSSLEKTYAEVFDNTMAYKANNDLGNDVDQNYLLYSFMNEVNENTLLETLGNPYEVPDAGFILTDNYAPVERLNY